MTKPDDDDFAKIIDEDDEPIALAAPSSGAALPPRVDALIDVWFVDTFHNRGLDVEAFNAVYEAKAVLKQKLAAVLAGKDV
jgi:uncharacterized membrane protein